MGKREVRVIRVPRAVSVALLVVTTVAIVALLYWLSGRAYVSETHSGADLLLRLFRRPQDVSLKSDRTIAALMPAIANMLPFVPWGFLAFVVFDRPQHSRLRTYAITIVACLVFAASIELWQAFLPKRLTTLSDSVASGIGALAGAVLGHLRKRVRFAFQV